MKMLSKKIEQAVAIKEWVPIKTCSRGPTISHLFFTDDIILMNKANERSYASLSNIMDSFYLHSGQNINKYESRILFSENCPADLKDLIEKRLEIKRTNGIGKYLRFLITNKHISAKDYQFIIDNLNSKLAGWKTKYLNIVRRITLVKSSLNSIPTNAMPIHKTAKQCPR